MRYSIERRHRVYLKDYRFLFFAKILGKILRNKYKEKLYDTTTNVELGLRAVISLGFLGLGTDLGAVLG